MSKLKFLIGKQVVIVVGAMKSATSSLFDYLSQHPQICASKVKETDYFLGQGRKDFSLKEYLKNWHGCSSEQTYLLEASPGYTNRCLNDVNAAENMQRIGLSPKIIYIMRDPIRRIESQIQHSLELGWDKPPYNWMHYDVLSPEIDPRVIEASKYATQIGEYFSRFSAADIYLIKFENLATNPRLEVSRCLDFLGLVDLAESFTYKVHNSVQNRNLPEVLKQMLRKPLVSRMTKVVPSSLINLSKSLLSRHTQRSIRLTLDQRRNVAEVLEPEMKILQMRYGFNTSGWSI